MGSDTKHPGMRGDAEVIVGYALTEKKCKSLFSPELIAHARSQGVHFLPIDPAHPIESQAGHPFDVVLQKVPAASPHKSTWDERIQRYAEDFPEAYVVDLPSAVRQVANRDTMLNAVVRVGSENVVAVRAPRQIVAAAGTEEEVMAQVTPNPNPKLEFLSLNLVLETLNRKPLLTLHPKLFTLDPEL